YPQTLDDLEKGLPELHFLRYAALKDPMNTDDGSWRFIYVNNGGQIIGSVRYASLQQMAFLDTTSSKPSTPLLEGAVSASSLASESSGAGANATNPQSSGSSSAPVSTNSSQSSPPPGGGSDTSGSSQAS